MQIARNVRLFFLASLNFIDLFVGMKINWDFNHTEDFSAYANSSIITGKIINNWLLRFGSMNDTTIKCLHKVTSISNCI